MGKQISVSFSEEHGTQIEQEAEELGLSRSKYIRQRIEAGRLVFRFSDKLDADALNNLIDDSSEAHATNELQTPDDSIMKRILANLSTDEERALTKEELREAVFGSEDEQLEAVDAALRQLNDAGKASPAFDGGYVKNE